MLWPSGVRFRIRVIVSKKSVDEGPERAEADPKTTPISSVAVIWERSVNCCRLTLALVDFALEADSLFPKAFIRERSVKLRVYDSTHPSLGMTRSLSSVLYVTFIIRICIAPHSCAASENLRHAGSRAGRGRGVGVGHIYDVVRETVPG